MGKKIKTESEIAIIMGTISIIAFAYFVNWQASVALFFFAWADNLDKSNRRP
jgi:hypothetical protein